MLSLYHEKHKLEAITMVEKFLFIKRRTFGQIRPATNKSNSMYIRSEYHRAFRNTPRHVTERYTTYTNYNVCGKGI